MVFSINIEFQIVAMILLIMVAVLFVGRRKLRIIRESVFAFMMALCFASLFMDVAAVIEIEMVDILPDAFVEFARRMYLISVVGMAFLVLVYTLVETYQTDAFENTRHYFYFIILAVSVMLILNLPIKAAYVEGFSFGPAVYMAMIATVILLLISWGYVFVVGKNIPPHRRGAIILAGVVFLGCGTIQLFFQDLRIMSLGISILTVYMYLCLENPDEYVDKSLDIFNYDAFRVYLKNRCSRRKRVSLCAVTIREFNYVRDTTGADTSEQLLKELSAYLQSAAGGQVFRNGSSGFIVAFERSEHFIETVQKIRERIGEIWCVEADDNIIELEMNASIVAFPATRMSTSPNAEEIIQILQYFIRKLYNSDSGSYICVDRRELHESNAVNHIRETLDNVVEESRLEVFYQPILSVFDDKCTRIEALMRVKDSRDITQDNSLLIPVAEQNGDIVELGYAAFEQVCRFVATHDLRSVGITKVCVNLSVIQCQQHHLASKLIEIMGKFGVSAAVFCFEITEGTASYSTQNLRRNMNQLISQGAEFIIDDYGTESINPDVITKISKNYIKLGRKTVDGYFSGSVSKQSMRILCRTLQQLKITIGAVGVDTQQQYTELKKLGISQMQGNVFYRPMDGETLMATLEKDKAVGLGEEVLYERVL